VKKEKFRSPLKTCGDDIVWCPRQGVVNPDLSGNLNNEERKIQIPAGSMRE